jgi:hypothetical protein
LDITKNVITLPVITQSEQPWYKFGIQQGWKTSKEEREIAKKKEEERKKIEEARKIEELKKIEETRKIEELKKIEEARKIEELKKIEETKKKKEEQEKEIIEQARKQEGRQPKIMEQNQDTTVLESDASVNVQDETSNTVKTTEELRKDNIYQSMLDHSSSSLQIDEIENEGWISQSTPATPTPSQSTLTTPTRRLSRSVSNIKGNFEILFYLFHRGQIVE